MKTTVSIQDQLNAILKHCTRNNITIQRFEVRNSDNCVFAHLGLNEKGDGYMYVTYFSLINPDYYDLLCDINVNEMSSMYNN